MSPQSVGDGEGSFKSIIQSYQVELIAEGYIREQDEDEKDGIRFVTLESLFKNKDTVCNR